jgi:phosphotransferase system enzyme I (PtsI)
MVSSVEEVRAVRERIASVANSLRAASIQHRADVALGAMVEVPAAALTIDAILEVADFVSLGTNDLVQYLLGVDRDHSRVGTLFDPLHPGVLRVIADVVDRSTKLGREPSLCGETGSDPALTALLVGFGLRSLSMAPVAVAAVKAAVRATSTAEARSLSASVLRCRTGAEVRERLAAALGPDAAETTGGQRREPGRTSDPGEGS